MSEDHACEPQAQAPMDRSSHSGRCELLDVVLSLGTHAVFADRLAEIQFMFHQAVRTRNFSLTIRKTLLLTLIAGFLRFAMVTERLISPKSFVLTMAWTLAAGCQAMTVKDLQDNKRIPHYETSKSNSAVFNMICAMIVSSLIKAGEMPMSTPIIVATYQAGLITGDRLRLTAASKLLFLNAICFTITEAPLAMSGSVSVFRVIFHVMFFLVGGMVLPMAGLAWMEMWQRKLFLQDLAAKGLEGMAEDFQRRLNPVGSTEAVTEG